MKQFIPSKQVIGVAGSILVLLLPRMSFAQCTQILSPGANLALAIASAAAGSTICLNSGNYGTVTLGTFTKNPPVIVKSVSAPGASMGLLAQNGANGVTFDGIDFSNNGANISGSSTKNITIKNSGFGASQLLILTTNFNSNNILIDHNTFGAFNADGGYEGRLQITWGGGAPGPTPSGVVVTNNTFGPGGCSDGIQIGARGVVIGPGNIFTDITQSQSCTDLYAPAGPPHVDAIQGYGQGYTSVTGNYFVNNTVDLGFYDGGTSEVFTNNVIVHTSNSQSGQMGTIANGIFRHNTLKGATITFAGKPENGPSTNLLLQDNIFLGSGGVNLAQNGTPACTNCSVTHNLFQTSGIASGTNNITGLPTFVGGASPATWAGWQLTSGSLGFGAGSDGKDMGVEYGTSSSIARPQRFEPNAGGLHVSSYTVYDVKGQKVGTFSDKEFHAGRVKRLSKSGVYVWRISGGAFPARAGKFQIVR